MTDFLKENEIKNLINRANMHDELGETEKANEIDELVASMTKELRVTAEQSFMELDVARIEKFLSDFNDMLIEMNQNGEGYLATLKRHLATPGIQNADYQKIQALIVQLERSRHVKL